MELEVVFLTFILVLSIFLGFELISKVPATLHTPLMSGANAISGITLAGAFFIRRCSPRGWRRDGNLSGYSSRCICHH